MDLLHRQIQDMRVLGLIKKYLKSGVLENGIVCKTEKGSPQGGPLSSLLANIYLNEFDWEMRRRGVRMVRYADDIVVFARSKRAAERLLESCRRYLEGKLKLHINTEKSKVTSIFSTRGTSSFLDSVWARMERVSLSVLTTNPSRKQRKS